MCRTCSARTSIFISCTRCMTRRSRRDAPEPARSPGLTRREGGPVRVLTSIEFLSGGVKVYETPLVEAKAINIPERGAVAFQFDVPLTQLKPGTYVCQVNVIDDAGGSFSFPRMAMMVQPGAAPAVAPAVVGSAAVAADTSRAIDSGGTGEDDIGSSREVRP